MNFLDGFYNSPLFPNLRGIKVILMYRDPLLLLLLVS